MQSAIDKLYNGDINCEFIKDSEEYYKLWGKYEKLFDVFNESLNEEQKKQFRELNYLHSGMEFESGKTRYKEGFRLGIMLGAESGAKF